MDINSIKVVVPAVGFDPAAQAQKPVATPAPLPLPGATHPDSVEKDPVKLREKLKEGAEKMNQTANIFDRAVRFRLHEGTKEMMISVVDPNTDKVIREIPPKEFLDFIQKMKEYIGLVFDKKA